MRTAFSFVDAREDGGWRVRTVRVYANTGPTLDSAATIVLDHNWVGPVEVGQLVRSAPPQDGRPMFEAWWAR